MVKSNMAFPLFAKLGLFLLAASALSGCVTDELGFNDRPQPYGGSDMHPLAAVKGPVTMEVSSAQGTLQPPQISAVNGFVRQAMQAGVTPITIVRPTGAGSSARVASEVASLMVQQGVPRAYVRFATYPGGANAPVRLSYVASYAKSRGCGQWPQDATDTNENLLTANHGCAVQANIAAEIANPETLVVPATVTPIPAEPRVGAITTAFRPSTTTGSTSSTSSSSAGGP
ncbi:MAG: CpaD family pilus assembly protein [Alphaproteobacteria bacterium]|nr:CpaD family pilus assembly protein [Alphaproteobacteria bacterium]